MGADMTEQATNTGEGLPSMSPSQAPLTFVNLYRTLTKGGKTRFFNHHSGFLLLGNDDSEIN